MKTPINILIVAALAAVIVGAVALKNRSTPAEPPPISEAATAEAPTAPELPATPATPVATARLPRLVDLGADRCVPCKMMAPILEEFQRDFSDRFTTEFIDVWKNPDAGSAYGIRVIPTQIFYDADGIERFRHEGFYGREEMLAKWRELGVEVDPKPASPSPN